MEAINLLMRFLREVFIKDDGVIRHSTYDSIKALGLKEFKRRNGL